MSAVRRMLTVWLLAVVWLGVGWLGSAGLGTAKAEQPDKLPQPTSYVSDFAGVVDAASKERIEELCRQVHIQAKATIEVVTVQSLDGLTIEDFTTQLEDKWKVGAKGTDKGVIVLLAIKEHKRRIEVGYGLEGVLNDAKVGDIGRSMVPQLQQGNYGMALQVGVQQIANDIAGDAGVTLEQPTRSVQLGSPVMVRHRGFPWVKLIFLIIFLSLFLRGGGGGGGWMWFLLGNMMGGGFGGGRRGGDGGGFGGGGGGDDFGGGFGGGSGGGGASGDW